MKNKKLTTIVAVGLMAALVFVGNYLQIKIPNGVLITRIHFGNSMCLLAGLLFGTPGALASGIGAALYDVLDPAYIASAPFTFLSKAAMGYICGYLAKSEKRFVSERGHIIFSAIMGQLMYIVLYVGRTFIVQHFAYGAAFGTAVLTSATNLLTSTINAVVAVLVSVPLYFALLKPLKTTYFRDIIETRVQRGKWYVLLGVIVGIFAVAALAIYIYILNYREEQYRAAHGLLLLLRRMI